MIDIEIIRKNAKAVSQNLQRRGVEEARVMELLEIDKEWREMQIKVDTLRQQQNEVTRKVARASTKEKPVLLEQAKDLSLEITQQVNALSEVIERRDLAWRSLPNLLHEAVPQGRDETENVVIREVGKRPEFTFPVRSHVEIGEALGVIDSAKAAQVAGSRFAYLKGPLVQLQFGLIQFVLGVVTDEEQLKSIINQAGLHLPPKAFTAVLPPVFIKPSVLGDMARLEPREDRYYIESDDLFLIGSAEQTLGPMHMNEMLQEANLPLRYIGYSTSFRREAGSYGKDVRGILRMHQFDKLEMETFSMPDQSEEEQMLMVAIQERIMQSLGLPYRVVQICTGDMGDPDARQIDIEVWLPGQDQYRETHTADLMTDYQARRLNIRVARTDGSRVAVHMNDATAMAMGRILIAIMENYQQADGSVVVPDILQPLVPFKVMHKLAL